MKCYLTNRDTVCVDKSLMFCFISFRFNETIRPIYSLSVLFPFVPSLNQLWQTGDSRVCAHKLLATSEHSAIETSWRGTKWFGGGGEEQVQIHSIWWVTCTALTMEHQQHWYERELPASLPLLSSLHNHFFLHQSSLLTAEPFLGE